MTYDILLWGLRTGLVVSGLIGLVLLLRRPFATYLGAEATFLLWSLPALRLIMPDIYVSAEQNQLASPAQYLPFDPAAELYFIPGAITNTVAPTVQSGANLAINIPMTIVAIWVLGAIMWLTYHTRQHLKYSRHLREFETPASEQVQFILRRAAALTKTNTLPQILIAPVSIGPMVSGLFRPFIILPKDFETLYSKQDQLFALTHELSHLKRRDMWWALAMFIFRAVNWYNPLVHYAARKFRIDQEAACDARTLSCFQSEKSSAHGYALTLLCAENTIPKISRMSDPLTLGMGHPVTERIRRLTMRKSNLLTRSGTAAFILAMLGVTAPVFSDAVAEPILSEAKIVSADSPAPNPEPQAIRIAEASSERAKSTTVKAVIVQPDLPPMRLRMKLDATAKQVAEVQKFREKAVDGNKNAISQINASMSKATYKNRFEVNISDGGIAKLDISRGSGGWPGYPARNTDWEKREMSADMKAGLKDVINKCAKASGPVYFNASLMKGDGDIGKGQYQVECVPGLDVIRNQVTEIDLAQAYLASDELPLEYRQDAFQWRMGFAVINDYVRKNPAATIEQDRAACERIHTRHIEKYAFTERHRAASGRLRDGCQSSDYNWVRLRENIPVTQ